MSLEGCSHGPTWLTGGVEKCAECAVDRQKATRLLESLEQANRIGELQHDIVAYRLSVMRKTLEAVAEVLKEPDGGSYWPVRELLDKWDIFNDDLNGLRAVNALVVETLRRTEDS